MNFWHLGTSAITYHVPLQAALLTHCHIKFRIKLIYSSFVWQVSSWINVGLDTKSAIAQPATMYGRTTQFKQVDKLTAPSINTYRTKGSKNTTSNKMVFNERSSNNIKGKSEKTGSNTKQDIKSKMYETDKTGKE